jgi:hypothetical protein
MQQKNEGMSIIALDVSYLEPNQLLGTNITSIGLRLIVYIEFHCIGNKSFNTPKMKRSNKI